MATRNISVIFFLSLIILTVFPCNIETEAQGTSLDEAKRAIAASNSIYFESFAKNDSSIFINRYAEDACIMAPFALQACGRENLSKFFRTAYDVYGLRNGKFITIAVYGSGKDYVTEEGLWQSINEEGEVVDDGKFLVLWKKTSEGWKMFRDSFSSNRRQVEYI